MPSIRFVRPSPSASGSPARTTSLPMTWPADSPSTANVVGRDQSAPEKDSNKNSQHYSDKAMTVLQQAVDRGWREADWIERDPELRSLHSRADFQALIKTLRQKPKSSPTGQ